MIMDKNVLISLTQVEASLTIDVLERYLLSDDVPSDRLKTVVKILNKFYEALEYVENS